MKKRPNILFSTTHMWNCGDDFINMGVVNLLKKLIGPFNPVLYNRHPGLHQIRTHQRINKLPKTDEFNSTSIMIWAKDNSWTPLMDLSFIDYVIYSGPEWFGAMLDPLNKQLEHCDIPRLYIGIGCIDETKNFTYLNMPSQDRRVIQKAQYIAVRDSYTSKFLSPLQPKQHPCPALLCAKTQTERKKLKKIALCTQVGIGYHRLSTEDLHFIFTLYKKVNQYYDCTIVCHRIEELFQLSKQNIPVLFSYDVNDYFDIYNQFDLTISTRIHGIGLCASLGIPGFLVQHSARADTANGFLAKLLPIDISQIDNILDEIAELDLQQASQALIEHKAKTKATYLSELDFLTKE